MFDPSVSNPTSVTSPSPVSSSPLAPRAKLSQQEPIILRIPRKQLEHSHLRDLSLRKLNNNRSESLLKTTLITNALSALDRQVVHSPLPTIGGSSEAVHADQSLTFDDYFDLDFGGDVVACPSTETDVEEADGLPTLDFLQLASPLLERPSVDHEPEPLSPANDEVCVAAPEALKENLTPSIDAPSQSLNTTMMTTLNNSIMNNINLTNDSPYGSPMASPALKRKISSADSSPFDAAKLFKHDFSTTASRFTELYSQPSYEPSFYCGSQSNNDSVFVPALC